MGKEDRRESFLTNLGRATRRGVRQCKKCGTLNGTRGYSCKNKSCDVVFKEAGEKKKFSTEACKIDTGTDLQIFSVRVRDKGPDYRGFVQLESPSNNACFNTGTTTSFNNNGGGGGGGSSIHYSMVSTPSGILSPSQLISTDLRFSSTSSNGGTSSGGGPFDDGNNAGRDCSAGGNLDGIVEELTDSAMLLSSSPQQQNTMLTNNSSSADLGAASSAATGSGANTHNAGAQCFVESCHRMARTTGSKGVCSHIKAASQCFKNSQSILIKNSVLSSMPLHPDLKTDIWQLANTSPGPLVQRVSKNIMVVKCQSDSMHPLGFLHFSFQSLRNCRHNSSSHGNVGHHHHSINNNNNSSVVDCGKYFCSCRAFKTSGQGLLKMVVPSSRSSASSNSRDLVPLRSCIHLFACLLALASHASLAQEFAQYIALIMGEESVKPRLSELTPSVTLEEGGEEGEDDTSTVNIQLAEDDDDDDDDDTTAYIRVSEAGSCPGDDDLGQERSFLILNDAGDPNCQMEVEVLQNEATNHLLQALDQQHHARRSTSALVTQDDIEDKLEIQLHTNEDGGVELCTADGGSISVHPCVTTSVHHHQRQHPLNAGGATTSRGSLHLTSSQHRSVTSSASHGTMQQHAPDNTNSLAFQAGGSQCSSSQSSGGRTLHHLHQGSVVTGSTSSDGPSFHSVSNNVILQGNNPSSVHNNSSSNIELVLCNSGGSNGSPSSAAVNGLNTHTLVTSAGDCGSVLNSMNLQQQQQQQHHHQQDMNTGCLSSVLNTPTSNHSSINNNCGGGGAGSHHNRSTTDGIEDMCSGRRNEGVMPKQEDQAMVQASTALLTLHNTNDSGIEKKQHNFSHLIRKPREVVDECSTNLPFLSWLAGVTERINHTMQYTQPGKPAPLVFHIPKAFFLCFLERIRHHCRKKMPNAETTVPNSDPSLPKKLTRYTWLLYNMVQVKAVFHTPFVTLQEMRSFLVNRNGTYQLFQSPVDQQTSRGTSSSQPLIRPQEHRTLLKVGPSAYQPFAKPTPFIVEWTPDVFPISKMGELRVKFEYEHIHNGQLVKNVAFKEILTTATVSNPSHAVTNSLCQTAVLSSPFIIQNTCSSAANSISNSIITASSPQILSTTKSSSSTKSGLPAIAPKVTVMMKDSTLEEISGTILGITLPHESLIDSDCYPTLLF